VYSLNNDSSAVQALGSGSSLTDILSVTTADGSHQNITVTINGTNDSPVISGASTGSLSEEAVNISGQLNISDADTGQSSFEAETLTGSYGSLSIGTDGSWVYSLNNDSSAVQSLGSGSSLTDIISVTTADGSHQNITVTINGTNDSPVISGASTGSLSEEAVNISGQLNISDADTGQSSFEAETLTGSYGSLIIGTDGSWVYSLNNDSTAVQALGSGSSLTDIISVTTADGSHQNITVTINGTNDSPVISGASTGSLSEEAVNISGQLNISDADTGQSSFEAETLTGSYGSLNMGTDGSWVYSLNNDSSAVQSLGSGSSLTDIISVTTADGSHQNITVTINGTNDSPVISGASTGSLSEEAVNISGQLNISDADTGQSSFEAETLTGSYGSLSIGTDGSWVYSLNNDSSAVQSLGSGSSLTDIISVTTADGSHQNITVTINGTNDAPTCSFDTVTTTENASVTIDALANIQDVDSPLSTLSITFASILGPESGSVSVVDNQLVFDPGSDFDDLGPNQTESVLINYMVSDGENSSVSSVMVTVTGQNDAPIVVNDAASVMEDRVLTFDVLANDLDVDQGDHLTLTHAEINGGLHQGAVSIVDNQIVYDPQGNFDALNDGQTQSITISYSLQDDSGVTASGTLVITVNGENNGITVNASNGDNTVMGGNYDDTLYGNGGVDHISGLGGDDYISGGTGGDYLYGGEGNDYIDGGIGSDYIEGGAGADTIMGGTYTDTALYTNSSQGVQVSLTTGLGHGGDAEGDTLSSIENLTGSSHDDIFWGNTSNNVIRGAEGNDLYHYSAGQGADTFSGGAGSDTIQLDGVTGSPGAGAWNLSVGSGVTYTIDAVHHTLDFSSSASGSLSLVGGGSVSFDGIEKISWG
jgi:VCBS repeat-containing protein